jgi:hypothetical protein
LSFIDDTLRMDILAEGDGIRHQVVGQRIRAAQGRTSNLPLDDQPLIKPGAVQAFSHALIAAAKYEETPVHAHDMLVKKARRADRADLLCILPVIDGKKARCALFGVILENDGLLAKARTAGALRAADSTP